VYVRNSVFLSFATRPVTAVTAPTGPVRSGLVAQLVRLSEKTDTGNKEPNGRTRRLVIDRLEK
jgi:hypothetical protein